jgi:hypothetical protein
VILDEERKTREATNGQLAKNLTEFQNQFQAELAAERRERQETEDSLIRLLEETCDRVEQNVKSPYS